MTPETIGLLGILALIALVAAGVHLAIVMGMVGILGLWAITGSLEMGIQTAATGGFNKVTLYALSCIPPFIFMGEILKHTGLTENLFTAVYKWIGRLPGGLAIATIVANAGFGAVCGSSYVATAIFTQVAFPEMLRYKYDKRLAGGTVLGGGMLAMLIPPSILMVVYGIITETSVAHLLIAGIGPGLTLATMFIFLILLRVKMNPALAPRSPIAFTLREKIAGSSGLIGIVAMGLFIVIGIYTAIFTPTEAGAGGALFALVMALSMRKLTWSNFKEACVETLRTNAILLSIILCATSFARLITLSRLPSVVAEWVGSSGLPNMGIVALFMVMYLFLGCILDATSMMFLTLPILHPLILKLGMDPIWFAMCVVVSIEAGFLTPPVGLTVYCLRAVAGDVISLEEAFSAAFPFFIVAVITLAIVMFVPPISTFIPGTMWQR